MIEKLVETLPKIDFIKRYETLCKVYRDFNNRMDKTNKKELLLTYKSLDNTVKYEPLDRLYTLGFSTNGYTIQLTSKLHNGLVEPYFFIEKGEEKLYYHRFDFICREMDETFGTNNNIPIFKNEEELKIILSELLSIYEDFKKEFLAVVEKKTTE